MRAARSVQIVQPAQGQSPSCGLTGIGQPLTSTGNGCVTPPFHTPERTSRLLYDKYMRPFATLRLVTCDSVSVVPEGCCP